MAIASSSRLLGEIFVQEGLTTPDVVERALARAQTTGELVGEALVALGAVTEDDVLRALALQQNLPYLWREEMPSTVPCSRTSRQVSAPVSRVPDQRRGQRAHGGDGRSAQSAHRSTSCGRRPASPSSSA